MESGRDYSNRLAQETSPYLRQHARNPVDWQPWNEEALARARREDKPILLSIGYSACHWCHVMAHESFEDTATAARMNALYVNVKVDREERPDLDRIYQSAHHILAQRAGGWPLTVVLNPHNLLPFFAGTYFPPEPRHGLPAFTDVLERVATFYRERKEDLARHNEAMQEALQELAAPAPTTDMPGAALIAQASAELVQASDTRYGGFGAAPKFPHATGIENLLRFSVHGAGSGMLLRQADEAARVSLTRMALGGIYDQIGGGFCRYSVDEKWMIPHFEKMLYDNGALLALYAQVAAATSEALYARIARETAAWTMRDMQSPEGGYYAALDADSEGEEGLFYLWTPQQVRALLDGDDYDFFAQRYGLDRAANFEGGWHLHVYADYAEQAGRHGVDVTLLEARMDAARRRLLAVRDERVWPGRDEKILTAWNALMIRGMALAARHLDLPDCAQSATRALDFIRAKLWRDGRLLASYKDGRAVLPGYLDDHAFLLDAVIELLQVRWDSAELQFAMALAEVLLDHFEDREHGGFYFTADDHETLIQRPKPLGDESIPAGNGIAAQALGRLGHLLGETRYIAAAERTLRAAAASMQRLPSVHNALVNALDESVNPLSTVVLRGAGAELAQWHATCARPFVPGRLCFAIPDDAGNLPELLAQRRAQGGTTAYLCSGLTCQPPVTLRSDFEARLSQPGG